MSRVDCPYVSRAGTNPHARGPGDLWPLIRTAGAGHSRLVIQRRYVAVLLAVLVIGAGWLAWRWQVQTVQVVIVNASGATARFSWQPRLFAADVAVDVGGCESKSIRLRAGDRWRFLSDRLDMNSSVVDVPVFAPEVAFEIWLQPDGSSRIVPVYQVEGPVPAPHPIGCAPTDATPP